MLPIQSGRKRFRRGDSETKIGVGQLGGKPQQDDLFTVMIRDSRIAAVHLLAQVEDPPPSRLRAWTPQALDTFPFP